MMVLPSNLYLFLLVTVIPSRETLLVMTVCTRLWDGGEGTGCSLHSFSEGKGFRSIHVLCMNTWFCNWNMLIRESGEYPWWYWKLACRNSWAVWFKFPVLRKELGQMIFRAPFQTQLRAMILLVDFLLWRAKGGLQ